ncbi:hypothetical protein MBLNU457_g1017t1 [Dothideomycetes sp. NU457]
MAPWDKDSSNHSATTSADSKRRDNPWDEENPFIAFRKFADEQFSALVAGFNSIPDLMNEVRGKTESQRSAWDQQSKEKYNGASSVEAVAGHLGRPGSRPWESVFSPSSFPTAPNTEAREAARVLLRQARDANIGVNPDRILRLYSDMDAFLPVLGDYRWLSVEWFARSPYSPTNVETDTHTHQYGSMWRAAFEDLMSAELGKELRAHPAWTNRRNDQTLYASWGQAPVDWMLGLQCRGILPPQLPSLYQSPWPSKKLMDKNFAAIMRGEPAHDFEVICDFERLATEIGTFDEDERAEQLRDQRQTNTDQRQAETELDLYEAFLGKAGGSAKNKDDNNAQVAPKQEQKVAHKPDIAASKILSTLSTTETVTLPDGTVTTKVVMKKRFSDGREESTETVSTSHAQEKSSQPAPATSLDSSAAEREGKSKDKKGWFWS